MATKERQEHNDHQPATAKHCGAAANIVRHITLVSCDAYFNEIISHVTQVDPVPAPGDEGVAPPPAAT